MKKVKSLVITAAILFSSLTTVQAEESYNIQRIQGVNRYNTSINISNKFNNDEIDNVIISSGNDFPDALAGSVLSKKLNAPILLFGKSVEENGDALRYIQDHLRKTRTIYLLGGSASVSDESMDALKQAGFNNVVRLGGVNRFDTNKVIVSSMNVTKGVPVFIANGYGFADALSVSSIAAIKGYPILMTGNDTLPNEVKDLLKDIQPSHVYLIGGNASINDNIIDEIKDLVPSIDPNNIVRIYGSNRYETSLNVCKYFNLSSDTAVVANGKSFPDVLSGSALAAKLNAPIILTDGRNISNQKQYLDSTSYKNLILLGGKGAISQSVEDKLNGIENKERLEYEEFWEFELADLKLNLNNDELFKIKGKVDGKIQTEGSYVLQETYAYKDCTVDLWNYGDSYGGLNIFKISTKDASIEGPRNIRVGDSAEEVLKKFPNEDNPIVNNVKFLYGKEYDYNGQAVYDSSGNLTKISYMAGTGTWDVGVLEFEIEDGKVVEITIWVPPV